MPLPAPILPSAWVWASAADNRTESLSGSAVKLSPRFSFVNRRGFHPNRVALVTRDHKLLRLLKNFVLGSCVRARKLHIVMVNAAIR